MLNGVYQNAAAMTGLENWNNSIAQNISQSSTPGYKKGMLSFEGVEAGKVGVRNDFGNILEHATIQTRGVDTVDFSSGSIVTTNGDFDFALEGEGFFELRAGDGQLVYTRDGQFKVNDEGELVSKQGFHVMDDTRNVIKLRAGEGKFSAASDGTLTQGEVPLAQLSIRDIERPENLVRSHGGFVVGSNDTGRIRQVEDPVIRHGSLEQSNVSSTTEMINLINVSRSFQINQKVIQQHDDVLGKAIQSLGGH
ncbi:flagellar hook-basal body protein [Pelagicoccus sp. SDUM812002]|uniref:flagellar hook-basal body protein n=1 Tax=Pelagicoccus sp. SDUM812002 TaxID=3041266 RepID=UPI00280ECDEB|nr:flagellar hook-basal body protein [Pelagicoccus sp. SDUM812002]MDQ8185963.1 flagellar hook-basal body protein [Pelagicoccus sp. SDUM812002]